MDKYVENSQPVLENRFYHIKGGHKVHAKVSIAPSERADKSVHPYFGRTPIILVHGLVVASTYLIPLAECLAPWFQVFIPEMPGYGLSTVASTNNRELTLDEMLDSLAAFMDAALIPKASLVGNSFGCQIIAAFAERYPDRVDRVVLQGPTLQPTQRTFLKALWPWLINSTREGTPSMLPIMLQDYWRSGYRRGWSTLQIAIRDRIEEHIPKLRCPILILCGSRDPVAPPEWGVQLARLNPLAKMITLQNVPHTANYCAPQQMSRVIRPYLLAPSVTVPRELTEEKLGAFAQNELSKHFDDIVDGMGREEGAVTLPNIADFDSSSAMLRATALCLNGLDFDHLGISPPLMPYVLPVLNYFPEWIKDNVYAWVGAFESIKAHQLSGLGRCSDKMAEAVVAHYPSNVKYPAIAIGSSNGALVNAYASVGIPWLPQTMLIPVQRPKATSFTKDGVLDMNKEMEWGRQTAREFLDNNPDLQLHHMADPNQDALMIQFMAYFRVKYCNLPKAYEDFIVNCLAPGGTILMIDCEHKWECFKVRDRQYFQCGAYGGFTPKQCLHPDAEVEQKLKQNPEAIRWIPTPVTGDAPESEWGFVQSMGEQLIALAKSKKMKLTRVAFDNPDDISPLVSDLYRKWYTEKLGLSGDRMMVSSFILAEPYMCLRAGLVPYWSPFSVETSAQRLEAYLRRSKQQGNQFAKAQSFIFSHGVRSVGIADLKRWRGIFQSPEIFSDPFTTDEAFIGVAIDSFPKDFACLVKYSHDMKLAVGDRYAMPPKMEYSYFEKFFQQEAKNNKVSFTQEA